MLESKPFSELVVARLGEFFAEKSSWFRGLWDVGTVPALRELLELAEVTPAVVSQEALDWYIDDVESALSKDGGVPRPRLLEVRNLLKNKLPPGAADLLQRLVEDIDDGYLDRWATAIANRSEGITAPLDHGLPDSVTTCASSAMPSESRSASFRGSTGRLGFGLGALVPLPRVESSVTRSTPLMGANCMSTLTHPAGARSIRLSCNE